MDSTSNATSSSNLPLWVLGQHDVQLLSYSPILAQGQRGRNGGERGHEAGKKMCSMILGRHWKGGIVVDMIKVRRIYLYYFNRNQLFRHHLAALFHNKPPDPLAPIICPSTATRSPEPYTKDYR